MLLLLPLWILWCRPLRAPTAHTDALHTCTGSLPNTLLRPCLQTPQSLPTSMTLALLCLQGATGGSCLKRVKPRPGSPLLGFPFSVATNPGQGMSRHVCRCMATPSLSLPPPPVHADALHIPSREHPLPCPPPLASTVYSFVFFFSMHVRHHQGTRHVFSYSRVGFD